MKEKTVVIFDLCQYSTQGLQLILENIQGWSLVGSTRTYKDLLSLVKDKHIDLLLCGAGHLNDDFSHMLYIPIVTTGMSVLMTNRYNPVLSKALLTAGFDMVISKQTEIQELEHLFSCQGMAGSTTLLKPIPKRRYLPQEREVLSALLRGEKARDIARKTGMSYNTVSRHKLNGLKRAGIKNLNELLLSQKS